MAESIEKNRLAEAKLRSTVNRKHRAEPVHFDTSSTDSRALYSKSLIHSSRGQVKPREFAKLLIGVREDRTALSGIEYPGTLRLSNPSAVWSFDLVGRYKSSTGIEPCPTVGSPQSGAEMAELYAMALLRDLPFAEYDTLAVQKVISELSRFRGYEGVTPGTLFRGPTTADPQGLYISQFLYSQKYPCYQPIDYLVSWESVLACQNGTVIEGPLTTLPNSRYMISLRDGVTFVHNDTPLAVANSVINQLNALGCPTFKGNPFGTKVPEQAFVDLGIADLMDLVSASVRGALMSCWYHKWSILRLRPEAYGMLIEQNSKLVDPQILTSPFLASLKQRNGTALLPQAYPEGSPCHPSYPEGHGAYAGAVTTILKAFFDDEFEFPASGPSSDGSVLVPLGYRVKVGDELDKLGSNLGLLRCAAGVHYRSDIGSLELGEQVAIGILEDFVLRYSCPVKFGFRRRNGGRVVITNIKKRPKHPE